MMEIALDCACTAHALPTALQHALRPKEGRAAGAGREDPICPKDAEAAHLEAAAELLQRHGLSLAEHHLQQHFFYYIPQTTCTSVMLYGGICSGG